MKSFVRDLSRVYECLFRDAAYMNPDLGAEFERDLDRLKRLVAARGLRVFLQDLPAVGKHLDRCLSLRKYISSGLPLTQRVSRKVAVPKFLRGLYLLVFDETGRLREDCDVTAVALLRQILLCGKKATVACSDEDVDREICDFLDVDHSLPEPPRAWELDDPRPVCRALSFYDEFRLSDWMEGSLRFGPEAADFTKTLDKVVGVFCSTLGPYNPDEWNFRHGPGAVSERIGSVNKYVFPNWSERLDVVYPYEDYAFHSYSSWASAAALQEATSQEAPSRLIAVPKTVDRPRLIAAEPTEHQWCQQNIWHYLGTRVGRSVLGKFLDFRSQEINQRLCLRASVDGSLATLDLSSASDRVTCQVVQCMFWRIPTLLMALHATRTRWVEVRSHSHEGFYFTQRLRKFATMGSACTFPVESLIFLAVALASVLTTRRMRVNARTITSLIGEVGVFGDDIVIPSDSRELCVRALELLCFKVNDQKSFWEGNFRESCGVDAFQGSPVTPAYWRGPNTGKPDSVASTVAVANNFLEKGYFHTAKYLASTVRRRQAAFVSAGSGVFGLKSHVLPDPRTLYKCRWNEALHREEVYLPQLVVAAGKSAIEDDSALLQYFTEDPSPLTNWRHGIAQRPKTVIRHRWVAVSDVVAKQL